jgi:hypothetical protein
MSETTTPTIDIATLSGPELKALKAKLAEREKAEKAEREQAEREYIRDRDRFISSTLKEMEELSDKLAALKRRTVTKANELHDRMYDLRGAEPKELKSFQIVTEDGTLKLEVARCEKMRLGEQAEVAIATIKQVLEEKFANRNKAMYGIINTLLATNAAGDYDERLVAKLSKHEADVEDERFSSALADLRQAFYAYDSATYARGYKLNSDSNKWLNVNLQFSSI